MVQDLLICHIKLDSVQGMRNLLKLYIQMRITVSGIYVCNELIKLFNNSIFATENSQGLRDKLGHVDFYINNAGFQPNCKECSDGQRVIDIDRGSMKEGKIIPGCSHKRAFKYFIESIDNADCKFLGIKCSNYQEFLEVNCL